MSTHPLCVFTILSKNIGKLWLSTEIRLTGIGEYLYGDGLLLLTGDGLRLLALRILTGDGLRLLALRNALSILASMTGEGVRPYREL